MRLQIKSISLLVLLLFCSAFAFGQTPEEIRKEADELFDAGLYVNAFQLYNKVSGVYNRDHDWNFRYGASLLFASHDKVKAIDRLAYSVTNPSIDKRAYYFLGRAYHLNYQFKEAQQYYEKFRDQATSSQLKDFDVNAQLNACKYGRKLLTNITDLIVMEKREIGEGSFYDLYDMSNIGGTILVTDEFGTKLDKKLGHRSVIHFPKNSPNVFYSSYGEDGKTGLDIYQKKKLPDGSYSLPQKVRGVINTDLDEDYAYMHPNGKYLYFCSKGHNSMGGYDVFRSPYDYKKDSFGPPENLDFAISSPDDDIMYVVDSLDRTAFFASRRESQDGKLFVYEVRVERIPMQIAAIKGKFENSIVPSNKEVNIEIEDFNSGSQIGSFNSKASNGDYFISFPKGGKYKYFVTVKGSDVTHYAVVEVPMLKELRPLKQKISLLRDETGEQYVKIENLFDERFEDPVTVMAQIYQELSKLNPNGENFDLDSLNAMKATDDVFVDNGLDAFSTQSDVEKVLEDKIQDLKEDLAADEENSNIAFNLAEEKSNQANEKMVELNKKLDQANAETDPAQKKKLFEEVYDLNREVKKLNEDAKNLVELGNELGKSADALKIQIDKGEKTLEEIKAVPDGDKKLLANAVKDNSDFFKEHVKDRSLKPDLLEEIVSAGNDNTKEANKINSDLIALQNEKKGIEKDKSILEDQLENTKKKKDREVIENQILEKESELSTINDNIKSNEAKYEELISGDSGPGKLVSVATEVADDKYDNSTYANELTNEQKNQIAKNVANNDLTSNIAEVDKTLEENGAGNKVDLFATDEKRQNYSIDQWTEEIDREIKNLRDELNTTPVDRQGPILEEIKEYEDLRKAKQKELVEVQNDPKDINSEVDRNEIVDGFDDRKIALNEITDETDRKKANLKLNQELKDEIEEEKQKLNELIVDNPDAGNLKDRLKNLQEIENELDNEIQKDQEWLTENSNGIKDPQEILSDMDNDYQNKVNQIYENNDESERKKLLKELNESVVSSTNERIQELDAILENDPSNQEAKEERDQLIEFRDEIEDNIDRPILEPVTFDPDNIEVKVKEDDILPDYTRKLNEINEMDDEFGKRSAQNDLNKELSDDVRNQIKQLNVLSDENPGNKDIKKRLDNLKKLDDDLNKSIVANEEWLKDNPRDGGSKELAEVKDINPDYESKMTEINDIENSKDRNKAIKELNEETIAAIDTRVNIIEDELENDPDNPDFKALSDEKDRLNNLKNQIKNNIDEPLVDGGQNLTIETSPSVNDILPNYQGRMDDIDSNNDQELEKQQSKIALNKELVSKIDEELDRLNKLKNEKPELTDDIEKRIKSLETMKSVKTDDIETAEKRVEELRKEAGGTSSELTDKDLDDNVTIADVFPEYEGELASIENSNDTDLDKENGKLSLNQRLLNKIENEIDRLEKLKADNPDKADQIEDRIELFEGLKSQTEDKIAENKSKIQQLSSTAGTNDDELSERDTNPNVTIEDIYPGYESEISGIESSTTDVVEREKAKINVNKSALQKIDSEISRLESLKSSHPDAADKIEKRISNIRKIRTDIENEIAKSEDLIQQQGGTSGSELSERDTNPNVSIEDIYPGYENEISSIEGSTTDVVERENAKINVNKSALQKIDSEISRLESLKSSNPDAADKIEKRISNIRKIRTDIENEITKSEELIQQQGGTSGSELSDKDTNPNVSIEDIYPGYENEISSIEGSTTDIVEREKAKINVNKSALQKIDSEISRLESLKSSHPDAADKIEKRISNIRKIRTDIENKISKSEDLIEQQGGTVEASNVDPKDLSEIVAVEDIYPEYEDELAAINNSGNDAVQKEKDKIALNKRLIAKVDSEIDRLNNLKSENPDKADQIEKRITGMRNIRTAKQNEILTSEQFVQNAGDTTGPDTTNVDPLDIDETATIAQVFPEYANELDNINIALQDDATKEQNKINLNKRLISKIDNEIQQLQQLKSSNPEASEKIDKRIESLNNIKSDTQDKIQKSEELLAASSGSNRPEITIGSLMPNYESDMAALQSDETIDEKTKLEGENELHEKLIKAIDNKISDLQEEWEENDELGEVITEELDKLEELKELKRNEIAENNERLANLGSSDLSSNNKSVEDLNENDFGTDAAKEVLSDNAGNLTEIQKLKTEIADLENQLANADNDKDKAKIQGQIDKRKLKLAKVENQVITDLAIANDAEYQADKEDSQIDQVIASANNPEDEEVQEANRKLKQAEVLMVEADELRDEAAKEKDPIKSNEILTEALDKENEAKNLTEQANRVFKTARVVDNFNKNQEKVIVEVPENVEDRESTKMLKEADNLDIQANGLTDRANELRDSANTVKKKYKEAILVEADELDKKAEDLRVEANDIRSDAGKIKEQEDEIVAVTINKSASNPDNETTEEIATSDEYKEFYEANKSANENLKKANDIEDQIEEIKSSQKRKIKAAVVSYQDGGAVDKVVAEDPGVQADQAKIDSLRALQKSLKDEAVQDLKKANDVLDRAGDKVKDDMIALADNNVDPREKSFQNQDSLAADYVAPTVLATDIFRRTDDPIYGDDKQIPIDQKTSGLVYKVQVGAFRKPLPQDYFKEFAPVSGQKLGNGVTRYMAGYFTKEATANDARGQIRGIGYGDAFVVAYCNGERITISEAREIEAGRIECEGTVTDENFTNNGTNNNGTNNNSTDNNGANNTTDNNGTNNNTTDNNGTNNNTTDNNTTNNNTTDNNGTNDNNGGTIQPNNEQEENLVSYYTNVPGAAEANQVEIVKGLFFTVQIGVYTKPVRPAVLFNIQPLNSQKLPNGNIRYSTGMYTSVPAATTRKNETVQIGVQDAFVTAYFNGERITIAEANELLSQFGEDVLFNSASNKDANFANSDNSANNDNTDTTTVDTTNTDTTNTDTTNVDTTNTDTTNVDTTDNQEDKGLLSDQADGDNGPPYRINLGYFNGRVPVEFTDLLLNNQNEGILSVSDIEDNVLYFVGTYESKAGAEDRMEELKSKGFKDAEVVSLKKEEVVENEEEYFADGVYYRVLMGRYKEEIPGEYATILLQTEDLLETEEDVEGTTYLLSTKLKSLDDIEEKLREFGELGFEDMEIVSYYQYDAIPMLQAEKIANGEPIGKLTKYEHHEGVDADPYLYNKDAIYFHVEVGRFYKEIPAEFTALLFENPEENILREETFDEELIFFSENTYSYEEAEAIKARLIGEGFVDAEIKAFHKYDPMSLDKAKKVLGID